MDTRYVRARGAYSFSNNGHSVRFVNGQLVPADHWAVIGDDSKRFAPVPDDHPDVIAHEEARDERERAQRRAALQERLDRGEVAVVPGVDPSHSSQIGRGGVPVPVFPSAHRSTSGPGSRTRDLARSAVDALHRTGDLPDYAAERVETLVTRSGGLRDQNAAASWVLAAGDPAYRRAFAKMCADPQRGHMLWTADEQRAFAAVEEFRAMSLADASGGYMVPLTLDPAIMLTSNGTNNPLRRLARVVQTSTDSWKGVTSAGVTAEWLAESDEAADGTPTLGQPDIPVHKGSVFVPFSYEVGMDAMDFLGELGGLLTDAAEVLQAAAFTTGDGTGKPSGVVPGATTHVLTAAASTFAAGDVYALQAALPPRFQGNAAWAAPLAVLNEVDQFETTNGSKMFPDLGNDRMLRKPVAEVSDMSAALTAGSTPLLYGDFRAGFVIVDRIGSTIDLIPHLMGANGRPKGERGLHLFFRTGSEVVVPQAFRLLEVAAV